MFRMFRSAIQARPARLGSVEREDDLVWGMAFEADCPIPAERRCPGGEPSRKFSRWVHGFEGRTATVTTRGGKSWEARIGQIDGVNFDGDRVTIFAHRDEDDNAYREDNDAYDEDDDAYSEDDDTFLEDDDL